MTSLDIGIVGAGFAGAAAALFLAERGHSVTLYEEAPQPQPVGAGILMQPLGLSVLADLGLLEGALSRGSRVDSLACKTPAGRAVLDLSYRGLFADWYGLGMHRAPPPTGFLKRLQVRHQVVDFARREGGRRAVLVSAAT